MLSFKDSFQLLVWQMFMGNGYSPDASINMFQFAICMWTVGPFI